MTTADVPTSPNTARSQELVGRQYDLLDASFQVWCTSTELSEYVRRLLAPFSTCLGSVDETRQFAIRQHAGGGPYSLWRGGKLLFCSTEYRSLVDVLLTELNGEAVDGFAGFAVHAGAVSRAGRIIAFPAASGTGKSTMVAACLQAGMSYVSDEALCFDPERMDVVPYPKPLRLSAAALGALGHDALKDKDVNIIAGDLGADLAFPPLALTDVVHLVRRPGPDVLTEVSPADAAVWLLRFSFNHYKRPDRNFWLVTEVTRRIRAWILEYEEAPRGACCLRDSLDR